MSLRLRPFNGLDDLHYLYGSPVVTAKDITEPVDADLRDKYKLSRASAHVRRYIDLTLPCINSLLCGSGHKLAAKLLGMSGEELEGIAKFTYCVDKRTGELISTPERGSSPSDYLFNGQALLYFINNLHVTETIHLEISSKIAGLMGSCVFEIQQGEGDFQVYGDWWVKVTDGTLQPTITQDTFTDVMTSLFQAGKLTRLSMLINLLNTCGSDQAVRDYLSRSLVYQHLPVIPYFMRPSLHKKDHPLTAAYVRLYTTNNNYSMYANGSVEDFKEFYKSIYALLTSIVCYNYFDGGELVSPDRDMKQIRPLLETIKGKQGMIRGTLLKKKQDYSGRSVVVISPFMPIDCIGVPRSMVPKLYRHFVLNDCKFSPEEVLEKINDSGFDEIIVNALIRKGVIANTPMLLGRNPTLHRNGAQGFHVVLTEGRAVEVSPLVCPAYNMDFDGDTAWNAISLNPKANLEIEKLILTDRNILLSKTGESTICPRMDIIYGLYMCTRAGYTMGASVANFKNAVELKEAIYSQKVRVWDTVTVSSMRTDVAGKLAFESCLTTDVARSMGETPEITTKTIKPYIERMQNLPTHVFDNIINSLVELGFRVAYLYTCSVSMLKPLTSDTEAAREFDQAYQRFHEAMAPIDELNDLGLYDSETYGVEYSNQLRTVDKALSEGIYDKVGDDSMYTFMAKSGARGNKSNLVQMFGSKGRIQKSDTELFNVVIEHSLCSQLTPSEGFIAANGARKGQISKSIKTADTGYLTRKMEHVASPLVITEVDCGTHDGITISKSVIASFLFKENMNSQERAALNKEASDIFVRFVSGRYRADTGLKITKQEARAIADKSYDAKVKIRSPLKCKNPCCQKCYGNDTSTGRSAAVGLAIGMIAAQSMGEPSTQLTMKEFQKGGTAGSSASPFDRLEALLSQSDIKKAAKEGTYGTYDPIAWAPGTLKKQDYPGTNILLEIVPPDDMSDEERSKYAYNIKRIVPESVAYKVEQKVSFGEPLRVTRGDCYVQEVAQLCGIEAAQMTLLYSLYFLFRSQVDLVPVHIETMVASMTGYASVTTNLKDLKVGKYYTPHQLHTLGLDYSRTRFVGAVRGVATVVNTNANFMESLIMEDQRRVLSEAVLNGLIDLEDNPLVQIALGQRAKLGTGMNENFLEDR